MNLDISSGFIAGSGYLVYGFLFPLCWQAYCIRHPPLDADDETWGLVFVVSSILCGSVTFSYLIGKALDNPMAGRYLFYSTLFGAILVMQATTLLIDGKSHDTPRGLRQTALIGLAVGLIILTVANATVLLNLVPSLG